MNLWQVEVVEAAAVSEHGSWTGQLADKVDLQASRAVMQRRGRRLAGLFIAFIIVSCLVHAVLLIVSVLQSCQPVCLLCLLSNFHVVTGDAISDVYTTSSTVVLPLTLRIAGQTYFMGRYGTKLAREQVLKISPLHRITLLSCETFRLRTIASLI